MKVGDYVRTNKGEIGKIIDFINEPTDYYFNCYMTTLKQFTDKYITEYNNNIKSSPSIIDLIQVGDYVNGSKVLDIAQAPKKAIYTEQENGGALLPIVNNRIESILTKEQFESMEYKIRE